MQTLVAFLKSKAVRRTLLSLTGLIVFAFAALYGASEWVFTRTYDVPAVALRAHDAPSAERGARLAAIIGCSGCHGTHGNILFEAPFVARVVTPDLARAQKNYSDGELIAMIRAGVKRDHTSAIIMPTDSFSSLADSDLADIITWLRALKPDAETETATTSIGPIGRIMLFAGELPLSARLPRDPAPPVVAPTATPFARGEYLVKTVCNNCHRLDEEHQVRPGLMAPPVRPMVQGYDLPQFAHLMRDGKATGERELTLMSAVARDGFSHFTDEEIAAIHAYLNAPPNDAGAPVPGTSQGTQ